MPIGSNHLNGRAIALGILRWRFEPDSGTEQFDRAPSFQPAFLQIL